MSKERAEEFSVDLFDLAFNVWTHKKWILAAGFLGALGGGLYGIFGTPIYEARSVISPNAPRSALSDFVEVLPGSGTGVAMLETRLTSRSISERVAEIEPEIAKILFSNRWDEKSRRWEDDLAPSVVSVGGRLRREHLEVEGNSRKGVVEILVTLPDSVYARRIADAYLRALKESIQENISRDLEENRLFLEAQVLQAQDPQIKIKIQSLLARNVEMALVNNPKDFQVVEYPSYPAGKAGPKLLRSVVLSTFLSGFLVFCILFGRLILNAMLADWRNRENS